jgi:hypothetical protein
MLEKGPKMRRNRTSPSSETELIDAVSLMTEELKVLRIVIDELTEEVQWRNQNRDTESSRLTSRPIHSCSLNPTSRDFAVNSVPQETVERLRAELTPGHSQPGKQGELFN